MEFSYIQYIMGVTWGSVYRKGYGNLIKKEVFRRKWESKAISYEGPDLQIIWNPGQNNDIIIPLYPAGLHPHLLIVFSAPHSNMHPSDVYVLNVFNVLVLQLV